jgi:hypothetical protein
MKSPVIMIGLLGKPKHGKKMEGGLLEPEMEMPEALTDAEMNRQNKARAVEKAAYGPSDSRTQRCGNCEYFNTDYPTLGKGQGFCEVWEFTCSDKNLCAAWEFDKEEEEDESEMENGED